MRNVVYIIDDRSVKIIELMDDLYYNGIEEEDLYHMKSDELTKMLNDPDSLENIIPSILRENNVMPVFIIDLNLGVRDNEGYIVAEKLTKIFKDKAVYVFNSVLSMDISPAALPSPYSFFLYDQDDDPTELLLNMISGKPVPVEHQIRGEKTTLYTQACRFRHRYMIRILESPGQELKVLIDKTWKKDSQEFPEIKDHIDILKRRVSLSQTDPKSDDFPDQIRSTVNRWLTSTFTHSRS